MKNCGISQTPPLHPLSLTFEDPVPPPESQVTPQHSADPSQSQAKPPTARSPPFRNETTVWEHVHRHPSRQPRLFKNAHTSNRNESHVLVGSKSNHTGPSLAPSGAQDPLDQDSLERLRRVFDQILADVSGDKVCEMDELIDLVWV